MSTISVLLAGMTPPTVVEEGTSSPGETPSGCTVRPEVDLSCASCVLAELGGLCVIVDNEL